MAKYESRSIQVHPDNENSMISHMERFGWELKSSQDVVTKDTHDELRGDTVYAVTETERFIKLVFQRDKEDEKYETYAKAESLYNEIEDLNKTIRLSKMPYSIWPSMPKWLYIVIVVLSYFVGAGIGTSVSNAGGSAILWGWVITLIVVFAAIIAIRIFVLRPKHNERWAKMANEASEKLAVKEAEFNALGI